MKLALDPGFQKAQEKELRLAPLEASFRGLPREWQFELIARLSYVAETATGDTTQNSLRVPSEAEAAQIRWQDKRPTKYVDRAETFVRAHPEGVTTAEVSKAIGQKSKNADVSLRCLLKRGSVERRARKWWPLNSQNTVGSSETRSSEATELRHSVRELILEVLAREESDPLSASAIYHKIKELHPKAVKGSIDGQIFHMRKKGLIFAAGSNGRGSLYALSRGGSRIEGQNDEKPVVAGFSSRPAVTP